MAIETLFVASLPSLLVGIVLAIFNKKYDKNAKKLEEKAEIRATETRLSMKLSMANGDLSYATVMALQRGSTNGEVEPAVEAYRKAKEEYDSFIKTEHARFIMECV